MVSEDLSYDIWAARINENIRAKNKEGTAKVAVPQSPPLKTLLLEFAREAITIVGAIGRNIDDVAITGGNYQDTMEGFLDEMLKFDDFVLLEYRYKTPSKKEPGLRFKFDVKAKVKRITVTYFKDLKFWDVDYEGRRIFQEPIHFDLTEGRIKAFPNADLFPFYSACTTWQGALRETLSLPFRHLYD
jgi:hypothetical protein